MSGLENKERATSVLLFAADQEIQDRLYEAFSEGKIPQTKYLELNKRLAEWQHLSQEIVQAVET